MDEARATWEGIAADVLGETGCDEPPVDAYELADCCGLEIVELLKPGARRFGNRIVVDARARDVRRHGLIAHELGHWALERAREDDSEEGARYLAGAFLLPRQPFERDLGATSWDLRELRARHLNASGEMIARRIVHLRDAVACIWDEGKLRERIVSPWLVGMGARPSPLERKIAELALARGEAVREAELVWAFPIFEPGFRRVITVADAEQLGLRF